MRQRTNIYLDQDQLIALKLLSVEEQVAVADLVRQAVDQLLQNRIIFMRDNHWGDRFDDVLARLRKRLPANVSSEERDRDVADTIAEIRQEQRARRH